MKFYDIPSNYRLHPNDRFYSEFFKSFGSVVRYADQNNWWFTLDGNKTIFKAQSAPDKLKWCSLQEMN